MRKSLKAFTILSLCILSSLVYGQKIPENYVKSLNYRDIGPTRQGGRYSDFAVYEANPKIFYASTGSGGLWKTESNGLSFTPIFDNQNVISIGDIAISQQDPDILYVGTGEANASRSMYYGDGIYKTTDGGKTWKNMGLNESHHISRIVLHPENHNIVYVAAHGKLYSHNSERGLYKSKNGGKTWKKVLGIVEDGRHIAVSDVVIDPTNPDILIASTYDFERKPWTFNNGGPGSRIYKTTNAGKTWTKLESGLPGGMIGRIGLAMYKKNPKVLYANIEDCNAEGVSEEDRYNQLQNGIPLSKGKKEYGSQVYRSDDGGENWYLTHEREKSVGGGPGYYYNDIRVDPNNEDRVYVLATAMHFSDDGGKTWARPAHNFGGGDNHAMWINPKDSDHFLLGYDHGMKITFDNGASWYHPDDKPLAQFYSIGVDMAYPYNVYGGLQDNGSLKGPSTKTDGSSIGIEDWFSTGGGDGMFQEVDPSNNRFLYNESQNGPISRKDLVTGESKSIRYRRTKDKPALRFAWDAPIHISPFNSSTIYHGAQILLRSKDRGDNWQEISPDLTTNDSLKIQGIGNITYCAITSICESTVKQGVIWCGTDDGNVQVTVDDGKNWTNVSENIPENPKYWVSKVEASNHKAGTAYVSYWSLKYDDEKSYIFMTENYGKTWKSISENTINGAVHVIREDKKNADLLIAGTTFGIYFTIDKGDNWTRMLNNMPNVPVHDLIIHPRENDLVVGTHGRGFFITDITPLQELNAKVLSKDLHLFDIESKIQWKRGGFKAKTTSHNFRGESEKLAIAINFLITKVGDEKAIVKIHQGDNLLKEMSFEVTEGINKFHWDMRKRLRATTDEEKENSKTRAERWGMTLSDEDLNFKSANAGAGKYSVTLEYNGKSISKSAEILHDNYSK